jgi:hypothetical protein
MKKFLLLLVGMVCWLGITSASATTTAPDNLRISYSVGYEHWTYSNEMTKSGNTFTYTISNVNEMPVFFLIHKNNGSNWSAVVVKNNVYSTGDNNKGSITVTENPKTLNLYGDIDHCLTLTDITCTGLPASINITMDFDKGYGNGVEFSYTVTYPTLYLRNSGSNWETNDENRMTTTDGITYTYGPVTLTQNTEFKIGSASWGYNWGGSAEGKTTPISIGETTPTTGGNNFKVETTMDATLSFNTQTGKLTVSGTITAGIEGVEAEAGEAEAEYFTVAGVRVDNPATPSLYLRRQGNKTSKVIIR